MSLKKKKHILVLTLCMVTCFILYQFYFFFTITSETAYGNIVVPDHSSLKKAVHLRSEEDKNINEHGVMKGVLGKHMLRYRPDSNNEFKCLKSGERIPFEQVNDDFCDCVDGTDEPSTSACPDGVFYCDVQYQKKGGVIISVASSRINDGICDCCDGSDEWILHPTKKLLSQSFDSHYRYLVGLCPNTC